MLSGNTEKDIKPSLAILDWGIGGIEFLRIFKESNPGTGVCYFSDSGSLPYGKQSKSQLIKRLRDIVGFLKNNGVTHLVVACNAMSTVLPYWSKKFNETSRIGIYVTGVIEPAITKVLTLEDKMVAVVGGRRTILSGAYSRPLRNEQKSVTQRIAQPLSALIEKGEKDSYLFYETLKTIMVPIKDTEILILACTHYPAALNAFQKYAPKAQIVNPALETLEWVKRNWSLPVNDQSEGRVKDIFYTTGDPDEMRESSLKAFGVKIGEIEHLTRKGTV